MVIFHKIGKFVLFMKSIIGPIYIRNCIQQCINIGFYSISIVSLTSLFIGFVLVLQSYHAFHKTGIEGYIGSIVILSLVRELGPVLTGIVVSGRIGGSITAEIGSMKVTEQLDAMKMLDINIYHYLIQPRIIASTMMFPVLSIISAIIGVIGGYICILYLKISVYSYTSDIVDTLDYADIMINFIKSSTFGLIASLISCFYGINTTSSSSGIGFSVTQTVIISSICILMMNSIYTWLFLEW